MYTPQEVVENNLSIDYKYYIDVQIKNIIDELLELVGIHDYIKNNF
jgi:DNA polymerase elongation subunit (family B)